MAEAVDRLKFVADEEQLGVGAAQRLDQLQLQTVGVLELVHHQMREAGPVLLADLGLGQQPNGEQLQVLEVEAGAGRLLLAEALSEQPQQLAQVLVDDPSLA